LLRVHGADEAVRICDRPKPKPPRRTRKARSAPERIGSEAAAAMLGLAPRTLLHHAMAGSIPGAAKVGGNWTFDVAKLRDFIRQKESETCQGAKPRAVVSGGIASYGAKPKLMASVGNGLYKQTIRNLRRSAAQKARPASSPTRTATPSGRSPK
jgi:hypothetical protein